MSLHTKVLLTRPTHPGAVLTFINTDLLHAPHAIAMDRPAGTADHSVGNLAGQGLPAHVWLEYNADGPITAQRYAGDGPDGHEMWEQVATGAMLVHFDTAYGYQTEDGTGADALHRRFIAALADRFGPVVWQDEYTGEWHHLDAHAGAHV